MVEVIVTFFQERDRLPILAGSRPYERVFAKPQKKIGRGDRELETWASAGRFSS